MRKRPELPDQLRWRDYYQIMTTVVMAGLSLYILWQTVFVRWAVPFLIFSGALLLYAAVRIKMIWNYFRQRGNRHAS